MHENTRAVLTEAPDGSVRWVERLRSETGCFYALVIEYPENFPFERPKAFMVDPLIRTGPHVLLDGSLCLFDDPWAEDVRCTALVVRNRAVAWLLAYEAWLATDEWLAPQHGDRVP